MAFILQQIGQISPSSAANLLLCPARAARKRGDAPSGPTTTSAAIGNAAHKLTAKVHSGDFDTTPDSVIDDALRAAWDHAIGRETEKLKSHRRMLDIPPPHRWRGFRIAEASLILSLTSEVMRRQTGTAAHVLAVEEWLESGDGAFGGRVDLVTRDSAGDHVVDLKTGTLPEEGLSSQHRVQLTLYGHLWYEERQVLPVDVAIQSVDGTSRVEPLTPSAVDDLCSELNDIRDNANELIRGGATSDAIATPGEAVCRWCPARSECDSFWAALTEEWAGHKRCVRGVVSSVQDLEGATAITIQVSDSNLPSEPSQARLIGVPAMGVCPGDHVAVLDAQPMSTPGHARWGEESTLSMS